MKQWIGCKAANVVMFAATIVLTSSALRTSQALKHAPQKSAAGRHDGQQTSPALEGIYLIAAFDVNGQVSYDPNVLLKDGTIYRAIPPVPLAEWDVAQSRAAYPRNWGHWQRQSNGGLILRWGSSGEPIKYKPGECPQAAPAKVGERLRGSYSTLSVSTLQNSASTNQLSTWNQINFSADGRFHEGRGSSYSDTRTGGGGLVAGSQKGHSGTYTLSGYTLTRKYDDGKVVQSWYCRGTADIIYLNNALYRRERSTR